MEKYLIFVEGKADVVFIRDFLIFYRNDFEAKLKTRNSKYIDCFIEGENITIKIVEGGGYTKIEKAKTMFETHINEGYKILIIQDADNPQKQNGGVIDRMKYLNNVGENLNILFDVFLFPDNENDGDLETLLLDIVKNEKFDQSFDCYKKYADCSKLIAPIEHSNELLLDKNVVFNYFRTFLGMAKAKEENRVFTSEYWDFENPKLDALNAFLKKIIKSDEK